MEKTNFSTKQKKNTQNKKKQMSTWDDEEPS